MKIDVIEYNKILLFRLGSVYVPKRKEIQFRNSNKKVNYASLVHSRMIEIAWYIKNPELSKDRYDIIVVGGKKTEKRLGRKLAEKYAQSSIDSSQFYLKHKGIFEKFGKILFTLDLNISSHYLLEKYNSNQAAMLSTNVLLKDQIRITWALLNYEL